MCLCVDVEENKNEGGSARLGSTRLAPVTNSGYSTHFRWLVTATIQMSLYRAVDMSTVDNVKVVVKDFCFFFWEGGGRREREKETRQQEPSQIKRCKDVSVSEGVDIAAPFNLPRRPPIPYPLRL